MSSPAPQHTSADAEANLAKGPTSSLVALTNPDLNNLPPHVVRLFEAAGQSSFFSQIAWYELIARTARPMGAEMRLYIDDKPATVGLFLRTDGRRRLRSVSNAYTMEHGPIGSAAADDALRRLAEAIAVEDPRRERITINALDPLASSFPALRDGFRAARWAVKPFFDCGNWYEDTTGLDFRRYLDSRPSMLRNLFRRKANAIANEQVEYRFWDNACDIERMIADYETVYRNSWKEPEPFVNFMPELIRLTHRIGALRMGIAYVRGAPAAAQFWILWRCRAVIYKLAYDERFAKLSLGTLLTMKMIERVLDQDKPVEIDFGRGDDPYKKMWLRHRRERWGLYAVNPYTLRGASLAVRWMAGRLRDAIMPSDTRPATSVGDTERAPLGNIL